MGPNHSTYLAGLWKEDLLQGFGWQLVESSTRPSAYLAPTFSWASTTGQTHWPGTPGDYDTHRLTILDARCQPSTSDICGQVKSGYVKVRGRLSACQIIDEPKERSLQTQQLDIGGWPHLDAMADDVDFARNPSAICLELFTRESVPAQSALEAPPGWSVGLLLTSQTRPGTYAELAVQNARRYLSDDELTELEKLPWYTRIGIVIRVPSTVFHGKTESDFVIL
jgi:hypothetical protein